MMTIEAAIAELEKLADEDHRAGLVRYGIPSSNALGVKMPLIRQVAKTIGKNQSLSEQLWKQNLHEAKHLAAMIADPKLISEKVVAHWVADIYSWDICDNLCDMIAKTSFGLELAYLWCESEPEFVKRCGFVTLTWHVVHNKKAEDEKLLPFFSLIETQAWDHRNFVKKAVNWLLRQLGKRSLYLHPHAVACAEKLLDHPDKSAHWIAKDALRELNSEAVLERLRNKAARQK